MASGHKPHILNLPLELLSIYTAEKSRTASPPDSHTNIYIQQDNICSNLAHLHNPNALSHLRTHIQMDTNCNMITFATGKDTLCGFKNEENMRWNRKSPLIIPLFWQSSYDNLKLSHVLDCLFHLNLRVLITILIQKTAYLKSRMQDSNLVAGRHKKICCFGSQITHINLFFLNWSFLSNSPASASCNFCAVRHYRNRF